MSVWQTLLAFDDAAELGQPIACPRSHVIPDPDVRAGWFEVAEIGGHVTADGADDGVGGPWPMLRVASTADVVLGREQAAALWETLGDWLGRVGDGP